MTSFTIVVPIWLVWVIVGALVVNTILTIINIRLRLQVLKSTRHNRNLNGDIT